MSSPNPKDAFTILVTGANSGVGLATCQRLIDEFLDTRPSTTHLLLIPTTRSYSKSQQTVDTLRAHVAAVAKAAEQRKPGSGAEYETRIHLRPEQLDLCSLRTVRELSRRLKRGREVGDGIQKIDAVICNAGIGGWNGIDWPKCAWLVLTDMVHAITWPTFKKADVGRLTASQLPASVTENGALDGVPNGKAEQREAGNEHASPGLQLGEIFCSNVFGHYMLVHELAPLLKQGGMSGASGRVIWVSSLEAYASTFHPEDDFQALDGPYAYESSKRLTDVLALTSHLPSTQSPVKEFWTTNDEKSNDSRTPRMYLAHPGICGTAILPLSSIILTWAMLAAFYLARWLGSVWHTVSPYKGAVAPVWLALASEGTLAAQETPPPSKSPQDEDDVNLETRRAVGKWGSATDAEGRERVERTEVEGWGWSGRVGENSVRRLRGRMRGAQNLTKQGREGFEELGRTSWEKMEELRKEWEDRLNAAGL
ncbi:MAG: hypothetical protein Q9159_001179 [Coniocarpon cinnabarinum]